MTDLAQTWLVRRLHIVVGATGIVALLAMGLFDRFVSEARWWSDAMGRTPFYDVSAEPFVAADGRHCVAVGIHKRSVPAVVDVPPAVARGVDAMGRWRPARVTTMDGERLESQVLAPGEQSIGPFCLDVDGRPPAAGAIWFRYVYPAEERRSFLLVTAEWDAGGAPDPRAPDPDETTLPEVTR